MPHTGSTPESFFRCAIGQSLFYRRSAGFFSTGIFSLFNIEILDFVLRGGRIELICSNQLAREDLNQLQESQLELSPEENISQQISCLDKEEITSNALAFFGTLIKNRVLNLKIAQYSTGGLFHDKTGCFEDNLGNAVTFRGSSNETYMGWSKYGNFETLETFCSWDDRDAERVINHQNYLEKIWENRHPGLKVLKLSELTEKQIIGRSRQEIDDFRSVILMYGREAEKSEKTGSKKRNLMPFQAETLNNWKRENSRGIIKHATGSGKTVTAIHAIEEHIKTGSPAIVAVPSVLLLKQWHQEILIDIPDATIQLCGAGNSSWKKSSRLSNLLRQSANKKGAIILVVLDTMTSPEFMRKLTNLANVLLVSDEVHSLGSTKASSVLRLKFGKRLGLSATPERYRDPEGTKLILDFFSQILNPIISIEDAIANGRLVNYLYNPYPVHLDEMEMDNWRKLTKQIIQVGSTKGEKMSASLKERRRMLLIRRSRIAKKAASKIQVACSIISKYYKGGEYWLVYCEDTDQLNSINYSLSQNGIQSHIYTSGMEGSKEAELADYIKRGGVMLSIRCLDEGVDIPKISHAVIVASSQNPRQFIQRRGRVLRKDGVKEKAVIYDLFCIPNLVGNQVPDALIKGELKRAIEFSESALNSRVSLNKIRKEFINCGLNLDDFCHDDLEMLLHESEGA